MEWLFKSLKREPNFLDYIYVICGFSLPGFIYIRNLPVFETWALSKIILMSIFYSLPLMLASTFVMTKTKLYGRMEKSAKEINKIVRELEIINGPLPENLEIARNPKLMMVILVSKCITFSAYFQYILCFLSAILWRNDYFDLYDFICVNVISFFTIVLLYFTESKWIKSDD